MPVVVCRWRAVQLDTRRALQSAVTSLAAAGYSLVCGLEIEFHIYRINADGLQHQLDPNQAAWSGPAPEVSLIHPGYCLLSEQWADLLDEPLGIVRRCAQGLGSPLTSPGIEFGPSQIEAVFEPADALAAADNMVPFRSAAKQALRRACYHATFMCRPPFASFMPSDWHLHQSLVDLKTSKMLLCGLHRVALLLLTTLDIACPTLAQITRRACCRRRRA